jgi:hypothetical protein
MADSDQIAQELTAPVNGSERFLRRSSDVLV